MFSAAPRETAEHKTEHQAESREPISSLEDIVTTTLVARTFDTAAIMGGLYGDGIIGHKGAFEREWVRELGEDIERLFAAALERPGGAVGRGPKR